MMHFQQRFDVPTGTLQVDPCHIKLGRTLRKWRRLSGGFRHQNHQVWLDDDPQPYVLRLSDDPLWMTVREAKLCELASKHLHTPTCLEYGEFAEGSWSIYQWIEGVSMDRALEQAPHAEWSAIFKACGQWLATIHGISFDVGGFFDRQLNIPDPVDNMTAHFWMYMQQCLEQDRVQARLGALAPRLGRLMQSQNGRVADQPHVLVHSDFNTKNIMLVQAGDQWHLHAIMDWEFAYSGMGLCDLGNFLRFEGDVSPKYIASFVEGYQKNSNEPLIDCWRAHAMWYDMTSLLSMLDRPLLGPKTQQTALDTIQAYMEKLA